LADATQARAVFNGVFVLLAMSEAVAPCAASRKPVRFRFL
jgi:hypothetical protein